MYLPERTPVALSIALLLTLALEVAFADGVVIGMGAEGDTVDGRAYSFFADVSLTDSTWISGAVALNETTNDVFELQTKFADISVDHFFDPFGIRLGGSYWGDEGFLESKDVHASFYLRGEKGSLSADFERRNFALTIRLDSLPEARSIDFSAKGYGLTGRLKTGNRTSVYLGGMTYDYSRRIGLQPETDRLRFLAVSRISLMNSLIDYRVSGGIEIEFGERRLDFRYAHWKTAVFRGQVDSFGVGWLMPVGNAADIEFRLALDDSDEFGQATVFSVFLYLYDE